VGKSALVRVERKGFEVLVNISWIGIAETGARRNLERGNRNRRDRGRKNLRVKAPPASMEPVIKKPSPDSGKRERGNLTEKIN